MSGSMCDNDKTPTPAGTSRTTDNLSSLSTDKNDLDEDIFFGVDILHRMDTDDVIELRKYFCNVETDATEGGKGRALDREAFIEALESIAGGANLALSAGRLFDSLDIKGTGLVTWDQFLDGIIRGIEPPQDRMRSTWSPIDPEVKIHKAVHCKRESIVKMVLLETKSAFCYAVVSKLGNVGVYDGGFNLLDGYKVALKPNEETVREFGRAKEQQRRRSQTTWITDVVLVGDTNSLLFSSSDRSLHLYDANCLIHIPICRIIGIQNTPTCLEYHCSNVYGSPSLLFIGDECGNIITMKFHQAKTTLFKKKHPDKLDNYHWSELKNQSDYVTHSVQNGVHNDTVIQITYCPGNDTLLSCSNDSVNTLVIRHVDGRRQPYVFRLPRGVRCFHYERSLHIIATGSNDFVVRIWNDVMTKQPVISLYGHKAPIVDVRIIMYMSAAISLSKEGVVKIWDVNDYYCQMTLPIQFPIFKVVGAKVDFGVRSIYPGPKTTKELSNEGSNSRDSQTTIMSGTELDEIETQMSALDMNKREEQQWNRRRILIASSNYIAILRLRPFILDGDDIENEFSEPEGAYLPPPPKEHFASAPSPWKVAESYTRTPEGSDDSDSASLALGSCATHLTPKISKTTQRSKKYQNFTADSVKSPLGNMNTKRTQFSLKQEQMKMLLEQCAPHLALDLHDLEPIKFSKPLPVTRSMREKGIDVSDPERLIKARIQKDPTVISLASSSAAQSPRSSKSSKNALTKKRVVPPKGRTTPEWFTEKILSVQLDSASTITQ